MKKINAIVTGMVIYTATWAASAAPFYSATMEATDLYYLRFSPIVYTRPESSFSDFWSFCRLGTWEICGPHLNNPPDVEFQRSSFFSFRLDEPPLIEGVYAEWATAYTDYFLQGFSTGPWDPSGSFYFSLSTDGDQLASLPAGSAAGILLLDRMQTYASPGNESPVDYRSSASLDATELPTGYAVTAHTYLYVDFSAQWESGGEFPSSTSFDLYEGAFNGSGSLSLQLSRDLADYGVDPRVTYGSLTFHRATFITLVRIPVTEPGALGLMAVGLLALRLRRRRLRR